MRNTRTRRSLNTEFLFCRDFVSLSNGAKIFYIYLNQIADDDGFSECNKLPIINDTDILLSELLEKKLIYKIKEDVYLLKHWNLNNCKRVDRYNKSVYSICLENYSIDKDGCYCLI